ncbi:hypothetical protein BH09PSE6_BH09PSE6_10550 [soil metagenome]
MKTSVQYPSRAQPLRRIAVAVASLSLGVAATFGSAMVLAQDAPPRPPMGDHGPRGHGPMPGGPGMGMLGGRLLDKVGATADQKARIDQIMKSAKTDLSSQRDADRAGHDQMLKLLSAPTVDRVAIEKLRVQQSAQRDAASRRMTQALADAADVLTPEQRAKVSVEIQDREARMKQRFDKAREQRPPRG